MRILLVVIGSLLFSGMGVAGEAKASNTARAIARTMLAVYHAQAEMGDRAPPEVRQDRAIQECLRKLELTQVADVVQEFLAPRLEEEDFRVADQFFSTTSGEKFVVGGEINGYTSMGLESRKTNSPLTPAEQQQYEDFFASTSGRKLLAALSDHANFSDPLNARVIGMVRACAGGKT